MAPCVVCFDDAHMNFPSSVSRMSDPGGAAAIARMVVELEVQLQQLADMQVGRCLCLCFGGRLPVEKPPPLLTKIKYYAVLHRKARDIG